MSTVYVTEYYCLVVLHLRSLCFPNCLSYCVVQLSRLCILQASTCNSLHGTIARGLEESFAFDSAFWHRSRNRLSKREKRQEHGQRYGWCSSNREVGHKQLHTLGIQDASLPSRARLLELHTFRKRSNALRDITQGLSHMGAGGKPNLVLFGILWARPDTRLHTGCKDVWQNLKRIFVVSMTTMKLQLKQEPNNIWQRDMSVANYTSKIKEIWNALGPSQWRWTTTKWCRSALALEV